MESFTHDERGTDATIDTPDVFNRDSFTISDLSLEFEVTARALRFYEDQGLISPERMGLARIYSTRSGSVSVDIAGKACWFQPCGNPRDD